MFFIVGRLYRRNRICSATVFPPRPTQRGRHKSYSCQEIFSARHPLNRLPPQATVTPFTFHKTQRVFSNVCVKRHPPRRSASFGGVTSRSHIKQPFDGRLAPPNKCRPTRRNLIQPLAGSKCIFSVELH